MSKELTLRIILERPVPGVVYGLQKGSGPGYQTIQKQTAGSADLVFEFNCTAKQNDKGDLVFTGPHTQGTPQSRFVYIDIGTYAGQAGTTWSRRLKVPLSGIDMQLINRLSDKEILLAKVPGTGKDGGPNCATVKPFDGWKVITPV
jgi:hypothetical protein